jgi:hypothetical protein
MIPSYYCKADDIYRCKARNACVASSPPSGVPWRSWMMFLVATLFLALPAQAYRLAWDASPTPSVVYILYRVPVDCIGCVYLPYALVIGSTEYSVPDGDATPYRWYVTAVAPGGQQSAPSNEVEWPQVNHQAPPR